MIKKRLAIILNVVFAAVALLTLPTSFSFVWHRPEIPAELLEEQN
jgi:hypothetical protein